MKIEEAIRTLMVTERDNTTTFWIKAKPSIQLGIEALERLKAMREYPYLQNISLLPSETEE